MCAFQDLSNSKKIAKQKYHSINIHIMPQQGCKPGFAMQLSVIWLWNFGFHYIYWVEVLIRKIMPFLCLPLINDSCSDEAF